MEEHAHHIEHPDMYDAESSKVGLWLFIFTELLLFGGLFLVYTVYRYMNPDAFHLAAEELNTMTENLQNLISQFNLDINNQKNNTSEVHKAFAKENAAKI